MKKTANSIEYRLAKQKDMEELLSNNNNSQRQRQLDDSLRIIQSVDTNTPSSTFRLPKPRIILNVERLGFGGGNAANHLRNTKK